MNKQFAAFIDRKSQLGGRRGFKPVWMPDFLFDFQAALTDWDIWQGCAALFCDCGLGKSPMQLVWAENVVRYTNRPVLILTPLAVSAQIIAEAEKFGIEAKRSSDGKHGNGIVVTNYERLHYFNWQDFAGVVCDESSILKSFDGERRKEITDFMRKISYRLLCTATAAPNDYIELGTSSEALGELGYTDMLTRFFKNDQHTIKPTVFRHRGKDFQALDDKAKWRLKGHAEIPFWRWVCSWARACRKPSDLGFSDERFVLPPLIERAHDVEVRSLASGMLFHQPAVGLPAQREERRRTIKERCEKMAELATAVKEQSLIWCHLNDEGDLLTKMIKGAVQVSGKDSDEAKEEKFMAFTKGQIRDLVTKPKIGAWGMNWQNCAHVGTFPSHSYEQYYQGVRRCWRFGQKKSVIVDIVTTEGERSVLENVQRKARAADVMFSNLVAQMNHAVSVDKEMYFTEEEEFPSWL